MPLEDEIMCKVEKDGSYSMVIINQKHLATWHCSKKLEIMRFMVGPDHPSIRGCCIRGAQLIRLKFKMAANLEFAESLRQPIQRCKLDLLDRVDTGDGIRRISKIFREL